MTESSTDPHEDLTDALAAIVADLRRRRPMRRYVTFWSG